LALEHVPCKLAKDALLSSVNLKVTTFDYSSICTHFYRYACIQLVYRTVCLHVYRSVCNTADCIRINPIWSAFSADPSPDCNISHDHLHIGIQCHSGLDPPTIRADSREGINVHPTYSEDDFYDETGA